MEVQAKRSRKVCPNCDQELADRHARRHALNAMFKPHILVKGLMNKAVCCLIKLN